MLLESWLSWYHGERLRKKGWGLNCSVFSQRLTTDTTFIRQEQTNGTLVGI